MLGLRGIDQFPTVPFDSVPNVDLSGVKGRVHEFTDRFGLNRNRWGSSGGRQGFSGDGITRSGFSRLPTSREEAAHMLGDDMLGDDMLGDDDDDADIETPTEITRPPAMDPQGVIRL